MNSPLPNTRSEHKDLSQYRPNVGVIVADYAGEKVLWCASVHGDYWQFPQGGIDSGEDPQAAGLRELEEETGLKAESLTVHAATYTWSWYDLPRNKRKFGWKYFPGQKQKWLLVQINDPNAIPDPANVEHAEFHDCKWVDYWYTLDNIVPFKRLAYDNALSAFEQVFKRLGSTVSRSAASVI